MLGVSADLSGLDVCQPLAVLRPEARATGSVPGGDGDFLGGEEHPVLDVLPLAISARLTGVRDVHRSWCADIRPT
jgi:hypothetical protein